MLFAKDVSVSSVPTKLSLELIFVVISPRLSVISLMLFVRLSMSFVTEFMVPDVWASILSIFSVEPAMFDVSESRLS